MNNNYVLIMAGGAGTRLWPISRDNQPKQFQSFFGDKTLLQHMVELCEQAVPLEHIFFMAVPKFKRTIQEQVPGVQEENILFEPSRRDNGPAILLGMLQIHQRNPNAVVSILWSDHYIQAPAEFAKVLKASFQAATEHPESLVTVGAKPTHPDPTLGYIEMEEKVESFGEVPVYRVKQFVEKPDLATASKMVKSWKYLWNVGYKIMSTPQFLAAFNRVQPDLKSTVEALGAACEAQDQARITALYDELPKLSIEYLFTPFLKDLLVIPADIGWSDIGNWNTLHDVLKGQTQESVVTKGKVINHDSHNSLIFAKDRLIAVVGLKDTIVVDEGDVIVVMAKDQAHRIKEITQALEAEYKHLL